MILPPSLRGTKQSAFALQLVSYYRADCLVMPPADESFVFVIPTQEESYPR
ncbi:MAG: hypothetical protein JWQ40_1868 [Segetibacter sp.]|nr:hypothetical protein [Segetibacter sp.]